ncbi:MAG: hypothetical protein LBV12_03690 [Puniceicoccales bacterium]|jgi:hypothetical protein|nr:hypothetical protein [Puniceicoccales bacterium]
MKINIFSTVVLALLFLAGCASVKTVNHEELNQQILDHIAETVNRVVYMGTKDGFHYLKHNYTLGSDTYRISEQELVIKSPFPLTEDRSKWRSEKNNWELWYASPPSSRIIPLGLESILSEESGHLLMIDPSGKMVPYDMESGKNAE